VIYPNALRLLDMFLDWDRTNPFTIEVIVKSDRIDGYGHVSNHFYIQWMTDCMFAHSAAVGLDDGYCMEMVRGMAVREMEAEFIASAYEGDKLSVGNWIIFSDGRLRASRQFQIINNDSGQTLARARMDFVCTNLKTGRPVKMPKIFQEKYLVDSSEKDI
tara:strand:+ start:1603 stop:2082 length:480 start_codon:yes stop_codon:yes gene_type:complete